MILTENGVLKLMQRIKSFIASQLNTKANSVHTHSISEIDDLSNLSMGGGYTKSEVDTLLNGKADTSHTHTVSDVTDFPTIPTKTSDLTNDLGFITSEIDSSGTGWVRFRSGLQICWGSVPVAIGTTLGQDPATSVYYNRNNIFNYPKVFSSNPVVSFSVSSSANHPFLNVCCERQGIGIQQYDEKLTTGSIMLFCESAVTIYQETSIHVQAIGRWK